MSVFVPLVCLKCFTQFVGLLSSSCDLTLNLSSKRAGEPKHTYEYYIPYSDSKSLNLTPWTSQSKTWSHHCAMYETTDQLFTVTPSEKRKHTPSLCNPNSWFAALYSEKGSLTWTVTHWLQTTWTITLKALLKSTPVVVACWSRGLNQQSQAKYILFYKTRLFSLPWTIRYMRAVLLHMKAYISVLVCSVSINPPHEKVMSVVTEVWVNKPNTEEHFSHAVLTVAIPSLS